MYQYVSINAKGQVIRSDFDWNVDDWDSICRADKDFVYIQLNDRDGNIARQWARLKAGSVMDVIKES